MLSILTLGFLMGMQHALEADHLAAVSSIASEEKCAHRIVRHGVAWGIGHSITLLGFAGAAILLRGSISDWLVTGLEFVVGVMLVLLGSRVIYRLTRDKVHIHVHRHADGAVHLHAHSHRGERTSGHPEFHEHEHKDGFPLVTLCVGLTHGMAGSAALLILANTGTPLCRHIWIWVDSRDGGVIRSNICPSYLFRSPNDRNAQGASSLGRDWRIYFGAIHNSRCRTRSRSRDVSRIYNGNWAVSACRTILVVGVERAAGGDSRL